MRILCLCKRHPQNRDLFLSPYGRFYYLPRILAEQGHEVHILLLSHKLHGQDYKLENSINWHSVPLFPWGPVPYIRKAKELCGSILPDWIIGFSDIYYGILATKLAQMFGSKAVIDAYDNFESYIPWARPLHWAWRHALSKASIVTAAGPQLAALMSVSANDIPVEVIPMSADPSFFPRDMSFCRKVLGLPLDKILLGYTGALHSNRGIELIFSVFRKLREIQPDMELVVSGRLYKGIHLPVDVRWLGYQPPEAVPLILNSLNVLFVVNKVGDFGDYSYPAKLYEAMACGIPIVASDVAGTRWVLKNYPEMLARASDIDDFVAKTLALAGKARINYTLEAGWNQSAESLTRLLDLKSDHVVT